MEVSILADLSVLLIAVLFFFLIKSGKTDYIEDSPRERLQYIFFVVIVGMLLLQFSVVVQGARYDYRFLLYALTIKYIGPKVTLPSIAIISMVRFFWGTDIAACTSLLYGTILVLTISSVNRVLKKFSNDFVHLLLLVFYTLFVGASINLIVHGNFFKDSQMYLILIISSCMMIGIFLWIIQKIQNIREESELDFLTQLKNSRKFYLDIARLKEEKDYYLCILDIDFFKKINDSFGHQSGDDLLKKISLLFHQQESAKIRFYRIGGEEFACLVEECSCDETYDLMETIRQSVQQINTNLQDEHGETVTVTISIGMTKLANVTAIHQSIHQADEALYLAKNSGRNCVKVYSV